MNAYDNDPRVTAHDDGTYTVTCCPGEGPVGAVSPGLFGGFLAVVGDDESSGLGFDTADEAIASLIGAPQ